jgi:Uma2 family endonuclease
MATTSPTRSTPDELLEITDRPMPEWVDGDLVEREPIGQEADEVAGAIIEVLRRYARASLPAVVNGALGSFQIFAEDPNKVRIPDVSFTRRDRLPGGRSSRSHCRIVPDLVVEVVSPNDMAADLLVKIGEFLRAGVRWVWVVNPEDQTITTYRAEGTGPRFGPDDVILGGDVLPGFECPVSAFFEA